MDVPRRMRLVLAAAAAKIVSPSGLAPPVVSHAAETPNSSARSIIATASPAEPAEMATPILFSAVMVSASSVCCLYFLYYTQMRSKLESLL